MRNILRPVIFFGVLAVLFIYGNSLDPSTLDDGSGNLLLACVPLFVVGWYFAPIRAIWLGGTMRGKPDAEKASKRHQIIGWLAAWVIINSMLFVLSQIQNGFWKQLFRH